MENIPPPFIYLQINNLENEKQSQKLPTNSDSNQDGGERCTRASDDIQKTPETSEVHSKSELMFEMPESRALKS